MVYLGNPGSQLPLQFVLALLNSKLSDWHFRLGSTNAAVSHYQLYNLPCPMFADKSERIDEKLRKQALATLHKGDTDGVFDVLRVGLTTPPST